MNKKSKLRMKYKMIVLDLDGTLTNNKKEITPRTKEALMKAQAKGVKIVLASGRPTYGIMPLAEELELKKNCGFILAFNGGKIIDCSDCRTIFEQKLDETLVPLLYHVAKEAGMQILTYQGEGIAATDKNDKYVQEEARINKMPVEEYDDFLQQLVYPVNKCLIVGDPDPLHQLEIKLKKEFDYIVLLEPTSPLRENNDIDIMIEKIVDNQEEFDSISSIGETHEHPSIMKQIVNKNYIVPFCKELKVTTRRQDNEKAYFPYGVAYIAKIKNFLEEETFYTKRNTFYEIKRYQCYEIDDLYDFLAIENIMKYEWRLK